MGVDVLDPHPSRMADFSVAWQSELNGVGLAGPSTTSAFSFGLMLRHRYAPAPAG